jgi:hypothetical protein
MHLSPAQYVVRVFGGVRKAARAIGRAPGAVSAWKAPKPHGCDGRVPASAMKCILRAAQAQGLDITERDLIHGRKIEESA